MPLHVSLLGAQSITEDATGAVRTRSSRTVALVAYLALHAGAPQTRQRIAGLFWPDSTDAQALTNLRRELHHLRRALGDEPCLEVTAKDLCWRDTATTGSTCACSTASGAAALAARRTHEAALRHADGRPRRVRRRPAARACTTTGCWTPGPSCSAQCVELCALVCGTRGRPAATCRGAGGGPPAGPAGSRWRRRATAP